MAGSSRDWVPQAGEILSERYRLDERLSLGSDGATFRATDLRLDDVVLLKVVDPSLLMGRHSPVNEFRLHRILGFRHPHIVRVHDVVVERGNTYVTSAAAPGQPLSAVCQSPGALGRWEVLEIFRQLASALQMVHRLGVHGNLKPSNVFIEERRVTLADTYRLVGTIPATEVDAIYVPPECRGDSEDEAPQNDVWALGLLLGWMLAGGPVRPSIALSHQGVPSVPRLDDLFLAATHPDPGLRLSSVAEFSDQLREAYPEDLQVETEAEIVDWDEVEVIDDEDDTSVPPEAELPTVIGVLAPDDAVDIDAEDAIVEPLEEDAVASDEPSEPVASDEPGAPIDDQRLVDLSGFDEPTVEMANPAFDAPVDIDPSERIPDTLVTTFDPGAAAELIDPADVPESAPPAKPSGAIVGGAAVELLDEEPDASTAADEADFADPIDAMWAMAEATMAAIDPEPLQAEEPVAGDPSPEGEGGADEAGDESWDALEASDERDTPTSGPLAPVDVGGSESTTLEVTVEPLGDDAADDDAADQNAADMVEVEVVPLDDDSELVGGAAAASEGDSEHDAGGESGEPEVADAAADTAGPEVNTDANLEGEVPAKVEEDSDDVVALAPGDVVELEPIVDLDADDVVALDATDVVDLDDADVVDLDDADVVDLDDADVVDLDADDVVALDDADVVDLDADDVVAVDADDVVDLDADDVVALDADDVVALDADDVVDLDADDVVDLDADDVVDLDADDVVDLDADDVVALDADDVVDLDVDDVVVVEADDTDEPHQVVVAAIPETDDHDAIEELAAEEFEAVEEDEEPAVAAASVAAAVTSGSDDGRAAPSAPATTGPLPSVIVSDELESVSVRAVPPAPPTDTSPKPPAPKPDETSGGGAALWVMLAVGAVVAVILWATMGGGSKDPAPTGKQPAGAQGKTAKTVGTTGGTGQANTSGAGSQTAKVPPVAVAEVDAGSADVAVEATVVDAGAVAEQGDSTPDAGTNVADAGGVLAEAQDAADGGALMDVPDAGADAGASGDAVGTPLAVAAVDVASPDADAIAAEPADAVTDAGATPDAVADVEQADAGDASTDGADVGSPDVGDAETGDTAVADVGTADVGATADAGAPSADVAAVADGPSPASTTIEPKKWQCAGGMARVYRKIDIEQDGKTVQGYEIYCIDRREAGAPARNVSLYGAKGACERKGKRLCSGKEWRRACGGKYPYGGSFREDKCNTLSLDGYPSPIKRSGSFKKCRSRWGVYDMVGNVAEWTADGYVRGGSNQNMDEARCSYAKRRAPGSSSGRVGYRCCGDPTLEVETDESTPDGAPK